MSKESIPCIVCGKSLVNVMNEENQPVDAVAFSSPGHYGSTVFDPMDGTYLEINVCDECIVAKARTGHVLWNKRRIELQLPNGLTVGERWVHRPLVPWDPDVKEPYGEEFETVQPEEVGTNFGTRVAWHGDWRKLVELYQQSVKEDE